MSRAAQLVRQTSRNASGLSEAAAATISRAGHRRQRHLLDGAAEQQQDDGDDHAGVDVGPAGSGAGAHVERRRGDRASDRHAAEEAHHGVGGALGDEVARGVAVGPVGVRHALAHPGALDEADRGDGEGRDDEVRHVREVGDLQLRQARRDGGDVPHEGHRAEPDHGRRDRRGGERQDHGELADGGATEEQDEPDGDEAHAARSATSISPRWNSRSTVLATLFEYSLLVAGQVAELTEDDQDADAGDEADHDAVGDELRDPAQAEQPQGQLDGADQQREGDEHRRALVAAGTAHGVGDGERDRARRGDRHEDRTQRTGPRSACPAPAC